MGERTPVEAINDCVHIELGRDENVMVMGETSPRGGLFRATAPAARRFGPDRRAQTLLAEAGTIGSAGSGSAWAASSGPVPARCSNDVFS